MLFFSYLHCCWKALFKYYTNMQQILYEAAVQMFFKIGVLKNLQIYQKKAPTQVFSWEICETFGTPFLSQLLPFLKQKSKSEKAYSHEHIHRKAPVMVSFLVPLHPSGFTTFQKRGTILDVFVRFVKFYRMSFLQKTAGRLLPVSSNISDISLALLALNQLSHSWLSV